MLVPTEPKIYHIVHFDRLTSIVADGHIWCDAKVARDGAPGTTIGKSDIKQRRLGLRISSHPGLRVGDCAPFYFCPRSVMLYLIYRANHPELAYRGGQGPIVHLEADLRQSVAWADDNDRRWAFTSSNAGSYYFRDYADLSHRDKLDWDAIQASQWRGEGVEDKMEGKQAEFLMEWSFPWELVPRVGVRSAAIRDRVIPIVQSSAHRPDVVVKRSWYY